MKRLMIVANIIAVGLLCLYMSTGCSGPSNDTNTSTSTSTGADQVQCNPAEGVYPTGYVTSSNKAAGDITVTCIYGETASTKFGFAKFNTSSVPAGATITGITLHYYVTTVRDPYNKDFRIYRFTTDPETASGSTLYSNGSSLGTYDKVTNSGWRTVSMSGSALSSLQSDIRTKGYIAIKFYVC